MKSMRFSMATTPYRACARGRLPTARRPGSQCLPRIPYNTIASRPARHFSATSAASFRHSSPRCQNRERFGSRLRSALRDTKVTWYPIPVSLGIGFLGLVQFYRTQARERERSEAEAAEAAESSTPGEATRPKKRPRTRPDGPWQVQVMSTLPLKAVSRLWGRFNELTIPYYLRVPGFRLYAFIFGVNLDEVSEPDLHVYPNLAAFFYRTLKPGVRPLHPDPNAVLSPADGRVLQYGKIEGNDIEQVKGMTYTVDALLGENTPVSPHEEAAAAGASSRPDTDAKRALHKDEKLVQADEQFAKVNGISYTFPNLLSGGPDESHENPQIEDQSTVPSSPGAVSEVRADLALGARPWYALLAPKTALYYAVVYLAPGDYHRFHSPANWVVERRRHFAGELYSVSPYLQRTLPGLFTLNERVVLLGRWRWGFFSLVPVGATNVGSIAVNFDAELRTNSLTTDTAADRAAERASARGEPYSGFAEAHYAAASPVLGGHALRRGDEMGGFRLGSTVVLVFEAPVPDNPDARGGFRWAVDRGQSVKMGQALGFVEESG
ncbi:phosphatidylserine decarboxylase [Xylariaceae sp. FL0804]|nr:phosphatidylserine decarboxylase [Xylariaceae sp. FL0804]